ncbi:MAG: luxR [Bacilli bacterium]|nr:luxR [Bacilli bacterium]
MFTKVADQINVSRYWIELSDIAAATRQAWNAEFLKSGVEVAATYLHVRLSENEVQIRKKACASLLNILTSEWNKLLLRMAKSHLFIFTDTSGIVLEMSGTESVMFKLQDCNIGQGTSFQLEHIGINGISLAMEMQRPALVKGQEHHLDLFCEWTCVCQPVMLDGIVQGYLDLSIHLEEDYTWALVLLGKLIFDIEQRLVDYDPKKKQKMIMECLSQHGLTLREKEIAWRWMNNQSTLRIAEELYLAEGTVRNHIKKVYAKTGVREKGKFIRKFV